MEPLFTEIIFPRKPKLVINTELTYWFSEKDGKRIFCVQCPVCFTSFRMTSRLEESQLIEFIAKYPDVYSDAAIAECPDRAHHGKEAWHQCSPK